MQKIIVILSILVLFSSCEDIFLKETDVNLAIENKLVVESFISPQDDEIVVRLKYAQPTVGYVPFEKSSSNPIPDATVKLSNGDSTVILTFHEFKDYTIAADSFPIQPGVTYFLDIKTLNGLVAKSTCTVPINKVDTSSISSERVDDKLFVTWKDIPDENNWYSLFHLRFEWDENQWNLGTNYLLDEMFTDENADGAIFNTNFYYTAVSNNSYYNILLLCNVDEQYYKFHKTKAAQFAANESIFSEPSSIYTNIEGGYGVFAAYNAVAIKLD